MEWQIERKGRAWGRGEAMQRYEMTPDKLELISSHTCASPTSFAVPVPPAAVDLLTALAPVIARCFEGNCDSNAAAGC